MEELVKSRTIVVMVMGVIFLGFTLYLFLTERRLRKLEKEFEKQRKHEA